MPRKERPAALSDSIFRAKLESLQSKAPNDDPIVSEEIPVHNTFIQFGAHQEGDAFGTKPLSTAPAWVGPSPLNALQSELQSAMDPASLQQSGDQKTDLAVFSHDSPRSQDVATCSSSSKPLASPKKVPVMRSPAAGVTKCSDEEEEAKAESQEEAEDDTAATSLCAATAEELPSVGSAKHAEGLCKRCCFFPKGRCSNGYGCEFCHLEHEKRNRKKKKKSAKRDTSESGEEDAAQQLPSLLSNGMMNSFYMHGMQFTAPSTVMFESDLQCGSSEVPPLAAPSPATAQAMLPVPSEPPPPDPQSSTQAPFVDPASFVDPAYYGGVACYDAGSVIAAAGGAYGLPMYGGPAGHAGSCGYGMAAGMGAATDHQQQYAAFGQAVNHLLGELPQVGGLLGSGVALPPPR